jgi:ribosome maturation factor RimP
VYHDIPQQLRALIEPVVADHGLELVDADLAHGAGQARLRVVVDTPQGDGAVSIERCAELSRELATQLEAADAIPGSYRLEVSSPGLDRILAREKDFERARGAEVRVTTRQPLDGRRHFRGRLLDYAIGRARMLVDGHEVEIPFAEVARAQRVYEFTRADFGRPGAASVGPRRSRRGRTERA